jgi:crotonobetainyl-CoA:carnitine CoA-transferase CaiB-like acyl-CoA transferase
MLALEGIRIADLSGGFPSALGTQVLGDHGAEVISIKEHRPDIDPQKDTENKAGGLDNRLVEYGIY